MTNLTSAAGAWTPLHTVVTRYYARSHDADPVTAYSLGLRGGRRGSTNLSGFGFGIGVNFQVPDVSGKTCRMHRVVLTHQLLAFTDKAAILALVIHLIANRL